VDALVQARGTELRVVRCVFRHAGRVGGTFASIRAEGGASGDDRSAPVVVEESHFDGGAPAIEALGGADVQVSDCTFVPYGTAFRIDGPSRLSLRHASVAAGGGPVFQVDGEGGRVRVDDSVIAAASGRALPATLVAASRIDSLDWLGRDNLYGRIGTYVRTPPGEGPETPVRQLEAWADMRGRIEEIGSRETESVPWLLGALSTASGDGLAGQAGAFQLDPSQDAPAGVGSRRGPGGPIEPYPSVVAASPPPTAAAALPAEPSRSAVDPTDPLVADAASSLEPMTLEPLPRAGSPTVPPASDALPAEASEATTDRATSRPPLGRPVGSEPGAGPSAEIRTAGALRAALREGSPGRTVRLAPGAVIELSGLELSGTGPCTVEGPSEPGAVRPRLRLHAQADGRGAANAPVRISAGGGLILRQVDLVIALPGPGLLPATPVGAGLFALSPGALLELDRCTVTLTGPRDRPALVVVPGLEATPGGAQVDAGEDEPVAALAASAVEEAASRVRFVDCLIRSATDLVAVGAGRSAEVEAVGCVLATSAAVVHAHGARAGEPSRIVGLRLDRCMVRTGSGLVDLESSPEQPEVPTARLRVEDTVLATNRPGDPLVRVDGQGDLESLRDRVRWEGRRVAYHQITTYRRDQSSRPGSVPLRFDRSDWDRSVAPRDVQPFHGRLEFTRVWDATRDPWTTTRDDARFAPEELDPARGPDLSRIPEPPVLP
jgi:hypothetical protein